MVRASSVDTCLICGQLPCQCNLKKAPVRRPRKTVEPPVAVEPAVTASEEPAPQRQSMLERMRARAAESPATPIVRQPTRARPTAESAKLPELDEQDLATLRAVRLLDAAFGVHGDDLERWKPYLEQPESKDERAASWRQRRRHAQTEGSSAPPDAG